VWKKGKFAFEPQELSDLQRTFHKDTTSLLLEGFRRMDEAATA
jgi:hypothetical protein